MIPISKLITITASRNVPAMVSHYYRINLIVMEYESLSHKKHSCAENMEIEAAYR